MKCIVGLPTTAVWFGVLLTAVISSAGEVAEEHPRILLRRSDLPELARRCGAGGVCAAEYQAMKAAVDEFIDSGAKSTIGHWLPEIPMVYLVEKSLVRDATKYSDFVRQKMWGSDGRGAGTGRAGDKRASYGLMWTGGTWFAWSALTYDWMYDAFTPEERKTYAEVLGPWLCNRGWMRGPSKSPEIQLDPGIDNYWYNQTWGTCGAYTFGNYYMRQGVGPKVFVALAVYGEGTPFDEHASIYLDSFERQMKEGFLPALNARGGVPTEGPYHGSGMLNSAALALEAFRTGTGEDLFQLLGHHGLLAETPLWYAYSTMPHNGAMGYIDDASPGMNRGMGDAVRVMPLVAQRFGQPVAQHYALGHSRNRPEARSNWKAGWYRRDGWADILWLDPETPSTPPRQLPLAYHFPGTGHVHMRSVWDDPNATWAFFGAGQRIVSCWGSDDEGGFQIFKGGPLATIKSRGASIGHNLVLVYDPDEPTGDRQNDGGLRNWYLEKGAGTRPQAAGRIVAYEHRPEYTYTCADLTKAYWSGKMRSYQRHFLYLRSDPECFVVYDRVHTASAEFPKTWQMYAVNEPRVLAGDQPASPTAALDGKGSVFAEGADSIYVTTYTPDNNPAKQTHPHYPFRSSGFGTMMVRVLLPEKVRITIRTGDLSRNPHAPAEEPKPDRPQPKRRTPGMRYGQWRIEEETIEQNEVVEFLNVLIPKLLPESQKEKAVTGEGLQFPMAEIVDRRGNRIRLRIASTIGTWEIEMPRSPDGAGSIRRLDPGGGNPVVVQNLAKRVSANAEVPGFTWNAINGP